MGEFLRERVSTWRPSLHEDVEDETKQKAEQLDFVSEHPFKSLLLKEQQEGEEEEEDGSEEKDDHHASAREVEDAAVEDHDVAEGVCGAHGIVGHAHAHRATAGEGGPQDCVDGLEEAGDRKASHEDLKRVATTTSQDGTTDTSGSDDDSDGGTDVHLQDVYDLGLKIATGDFAEVYEATQKHTGRKVAVKVQNRRLMTPLQEDFLRSEVSILHAMDHPSIVRLLDFYETPKRYFLVMELCQGGQLLDRIVDKDHYCEAEARDTVRVLFEALEYCHAHNVVHRDLKPENLLMVKRDSDTDIKLGDFGFASRIGDNESLEHPCGSPDYAAPEVLNQRPYGRKIDIWSAGVIAYVLLAGYNPWQVQVDVPLDHQLYYHRLFEVVRKGDFDFDHENWDHVSKEAKDFLSKVIVVDPNKRLTAAEALQHPWILAPSEVLRRHDLSGFTLPWLKDHTEARRQRGPPCLLVDVLKRVMHAIAHPLHHSNHHDHDDKHDHNKGGDEGAPTGAAAESKV